MGGSYSQTQTSLPSQRHTQVGSDLAEAVSRARRSRCPRSGALIGVSDSTARAFVLPCGGWACSSCGRRKEGDVERALIHGVLAAQERSERVRFFTLTYEDWRGVAIKQAKADWNRLRTNLRKNGLLERYAWVLELKGAVVHLHVLATGRYIPHARLSVLAQKAGLRPGTEGSAPLRGPRPPQEGQVRHGR
jgi:hypothetical protein